MTVVRKYPALYVNQWHVLSRSNRFLLLVTLPSLQSKRAKNAHIWLWWEAIDLSWPRADHMCPTGNTRKCYQKCQSRIIRSANNCQSLRCKSADLTSAAPNVRQPTLPCHKAAFLLKTYGAVALTGGADQHGASNAVSKDFVCLIIDIVYIRLLHWWFVLCRHSCPSRLSHTLVVYIHLPNFWGTSEPTHILILVFDPPLVALSMTIPKDTRTINQLDL